MPLDRNDPDLNAYKSAKTDAEKRKYADRLLRANVSLVHRLVNKYSKHVIGVEYEDLFQAGCLAFLKTLEKVDPAKGSFSTLMGCWVRYEIGKCVQDSNIIHTPRSAHMAYKTKRLFEAIIARTGRPPTAEELGVSEEKHQRWLTLPHVGASLDEPFSAPCKAAVPKTLYDSIPDDVPSAEEALAKGELEDSVNAALKTLTWEQYLVMLCIYWGNKSHEDAANELNMSVEAVVNAEAAALVSLKGLLE